MEDDMESLENIFKIFLGHPSRFNKIKYIFFYYLNMNQS